MKLCALLMALSIPAAFGADKHEQGVEVGKHTQRLEDATAVLDEVMRTPDRAIPQNLLDRAHCIVIIPSLVKGAFVLGAQYGKGYLSCRNTTKEGWSAPATVRIEGGSFGFQAGGMATDVIMLVMNTRGVDGLMASKFTLGGAAEAAAGPVGRATTAQTDALMRAQILSWSRSRGVFAGVSLKGATLRQDIDSNQRLYGKRLTTRQIVRDPNLQPTPGGAQLIALLSRLSPKEIRQGAPVGE